MAKIPAFLQHLYTIILILVGWIFFRLTNVSLWGAFFKALLGGNGWSGTDTLRSMNILFYFPIMIVAAIFCTPLFSKLESKIQGQPGYKRALLDFGYLAMFVFVICYLLSNGFTSFLYAQF